MRTVEFKMERPGLVSAGDKVKIIEREGTSSYSYIIDPAVAMSGCFAARDRIKSEYGIVKDVRENSRGFYVVVDLMRKMFIKFSPNLLPVLFMITARS